ADRTQHLVFGPAEVDQRAEIAGDGNAMHRDFLVSRDTDFRNLGDMPGVTEMEREPEGPALREFAPPPGLGGGEVDHADCPTGVERGSRWRREPARLAEDVEQKVSMVAVCLHREFMQKTLNCERLCTIAGRAPWAAARAERQHGLCDV